MLRVGDCTRRAVTAGLLVVAAVLLLDRSGAGGDVARVVAPSPRAGAPLSQLVSQSNPDNLPPDCIPQSQGPPSSPYELGLVGTVTNGSLAAGPATVNNITAKFCGVVTVVGGSGQCPAVGQVASSADDQKFGPLNADLTLVPGIQPSVPFAVVPGTITGGFACTTSQNGLLVILHAVVAGTTGLFGLQCGVGPFPLTLTGTVTGPLNQVTGTFRSSNFAVPAVGPSRACSAQVASNLNAIAGLPIAPGGASITLDITGSLYQPS